MTGGYTPVAWIAADWQFRISEAKVSLLGMEPSAEVLVGRGYFSGSPEVLSEVISESHVISMDFRRFEHAGTR
jgi:hypothetical protein